MTDLKPCPFCGSFTDLEPEDTRVKCYSCGASNWREQWNTRVSPWRSLKDDPPRLAMRVILRAPALFRIHIASDSSNAEFLGKGYDSWMEVPS